MIVIYRWVLVLVLILTWPIQFASASEEQGIDFQKRHDVLFNLKSLDQYTANNKDRFSGDLVEAKKCCKVCKKGKACGDSCIKKSYSCTKTKGCACNG